MQLQTVIGQLCQVCMGWYFYGDSLARIVAKVSSLKKLIVCVDKYSSVGKSISIRTWFDVITMSIKIVFLNRETIRCKTTWRYCEIKCKKIEVYTNPCIDKNNLISATSCYIIFELRHMVDKSLFICLWLDGSIFFYSLSYFFIIFFFPYQRIQ